MTLYQLAEEALARLAGQLLSSSCFARVFSQALTSAFEAKGRVDRTVQTLLGLLNLPSRADLARLATKLDLVQGSLVNLNLKVDRLMAAPPARQRRKRRKAPDTAPPPMPVDE